MSLETVIGGWMLVPALIGTFGIGLLVGRELGFRQAVRCFKDFAEGSKP